MRAGLGENERDVFRIREARDQSGIDALAAVPRAEVLSSARVRDATVALVQLLERTRPVAAANSGVFAEPSRGRKRAAGRRGTARDRARNHGGARALAAKGAHRRADRRGNCVSQGFRRKVYDGVVAMYHDQATIPLKLVAFGDAVNVTMGLSIVRTSVDHGTAYDIAWQGVADGSGMSSAMKLAARLLGAN